ncbi:MAG: cyclic lactone autoinducer peptide [Clostridiales bacterium]|nr:cyclic lactone autoinducer peptide [Clostridiales bacterium]MBR5938773.1 cyclic lactone autoinducer peptide [Clostridiales bacterium]
MKKQKSTVSVKNAGKALAVRVAEHYVNVSCPLIFHQPKLPESVKGLRKF